MSKIIDLTGQRYGRLVVLSRASSSLQPSGQKATQWKCQCDCGNTAVVRAANMRTGRAQSCGCLHMEKLRLNFRTHGMTQTPEHISWKSMIQRCDYPRHNRYHLYGWRGIKIAPEWREFARFLADMGKRPTPQHSLDRIDPNGDYAPGNCRWATPKEQQRNKSNTIYVTWDGKRIPLIEAAERAGLFSSTVRRRIRAGWPDSDLFLPVRARRSQ
jgi:hypothetical protein